MCDALRCCCRDGLLLPCFIHKRPLFRLLVEEAAMVTSIQTSQICRNVSEARPWAVAVNVDDRSSNARKKGSSEPNDSRKKSFFPPETKTSCFDPDDNVKLPAFSFGIQAMTTVSCVAITEGSGTGSSRGGCGRGSFPLETENEREGAREKAVNVDDTECSDRDGQRRNSCLRDCVRC